MIKFKIFGYSTDFRMSQHDENRGEVRLENDKRHVLKDSQKHGEGIEFLLLIR